MKEDEALTAVSTGPCLPVLKPFWSNGFKSNKPGLAVKESRQIRTLLCVHAKTYVMGRHSVHANTHVYTSTSSHMFMLQLMFMHSCMLYVYM